MDLRPVWESPTKVKKGIDGSQRLGELRSEGAPVEPINPARKIVD
jgi:hypothetical protein